MAGRTASLKPWEKTVEWDWVRTEGSQPLWRAHCAGVGDRGAPGPRYLTISRQNWQAPMASSFLNHGNAYPACLRVVLCQCCDQSHQGLFLCWLRKLCALGEPLRGTAISWQVGGDSILAESGLLCAERNLWKFVEKFLLCDFSKKRWAEEMTEGKKEGRRASVIETVKIRLTLCR